MLPMAAAPASRPAEPERSGASASRAWTARPARRRCEKVVAALDGVARGAGVVRRRDADRRRRRRARAASSAAVARAGYRARAGRRGGRASRPRRSGGATRATVVDGAAVVAAAGRGGRRVAASGRRARSPSRCTWLSMAVGGWPSPARRSPRSRRRSLDMNVLMTLAAVGAVGIGAYAEGAWVLVLFAVGTTLEAWRSTAAAGRSTR